MHINDDVSLYGSCVCVCGMGGGRAGEGGQGRGREGKGGEGKGITR